MSFAGTLIDHSKLEDIAYNGNQSDDDDEVYLSGDERDADDDEVRDCFPNETVVANKRCKIYPKSRHYSIVRFGDGYADKAIALPKVICYEDDLIDGENMMSEISWGHDGWINARRDMSSPIKWKVTLLWTGTRKPSGLNNNAHHDDEQWRQLLQEYRDLGDVDASMRRVSVPTLKSLASDLHASDKFFVDTRENGAPGCDNGVHSNSREFSNMLEDIDERQSEMNIRCADTSRNRSFITVCEGLQKVAVVEKVERDRLIFMPLNYKESKFQGIYSLSVSKKKVIIQGERAEKFDLKSKVSPGESFNIKCDLLYDEETKEKFGDIKEAWNGKARNMSLHSYTNESKGKLINTSPLPDNKSLEPIDATDSNNSADNFEFIRHIGGKLKLITQSFICIEPLKKEYKDKEPYPLLSKNFYFANGKTGDAYEDLRTSDLKVGDFLKMNAAVIDGKLMVISAWEAGAKPPKNDENKAAGFAREIKKKNQKPVSTATHGKLEEPTPESQMSARPHSPSYFRLNPSALLRRPKPATFADYKQPPLRIPGKLPQSSSTFQSSDSPAEISPNKVTKGIISSSKISNLSRPKSVSYQEPLSPLPTSMAQCSTFTNKETKIMNYTESNIELDNKTVSFSDRSNPRAVLNIIERCFQKSMEKLKPANSYEGAIAYRTQLLAVTKQMFLENLNRELQIPTMCAEQAWSCFEKFITHFYLVGDEMKGDFSYPHSKSLKCNINAIPVPTADANTQTMIIGPVYSCELLIETPPERQWK